MAFNSIDLGSIELNPSAIRIRSASIIIFINHPNSNITKTALILKEIQKKAKNCRSRVERFITRKVIAIAV
jgi:hypothetical protein